jgi:hypothetical protein
MEELPIIQRRTVKSCIRLGKPVIVATQMLESMITNPLPTRAEITDVANAVFEQTDAIMLSAETSIGRYPVECVRVLDRVALRIERSGGWLRSRGSSQRRPAKDRCFRSGPGKFERPKIVVLPGTGRWRAMYHTFVRKMRPSLPSHRAQEFTANCRSCGAFIR